MLLLGKILALMHFVWKWVNKNVMYIFPAMWNYKDENITYDILCTFLFSGLKVHEVEGRRQKNEPVSVLMSKDLLYLQTN